MYVHRAAPNHAKPNHNFPMAPFIFLLYFNPGIKPGGYQYATPPGLLALVGHAFVSLRQINILH